MPVERFINGNIQESICNNEQVYQSPFSIRVRIGKKSRKIRWFKLVLPSRNEVSQKCDLRKMKLQGFFGIPYSL